MSEFFDQFRPLLEFSNWVGIITLIGVVFITVCLYRSCWTTREGYRTVCYSPVGRSQADKGPGWYCQLWPFWSRTTNFCEEQNEPLPEGRFVTKDGVPWRLRGSVSFSVVNLQKREIRVDDADKQMPNEAMAELIDNFRKQDHEHCRAGKYTPDVIPVTAQRAGCWGIEINCLNITESEPANAEGRSVALFMELAKRRMMILKKLGKEGITNPVVQATVIGAPISAVSLGDNLSTLQGTVEEKGDEILGEIREEEPEPSIVLQVVEEVVGVFPGGQTLINSWKKGDSA